MKKLMFICNTRSTKHYKHIFLQLILLLQKIMEKNIIFVLLSYTCFMQRYNLKKILPFAEQSEFRPWKTCGDKYLECGFVGVGGEVRLKTDVVVQGSAASRTAFDSVETTGISLVTRTSIPTDCQKEY